jgi:hypothetical protein
MPISWLMISNICGKYKIKFREYFTYNILYGYIIFNDAHGYGVLEHLIGCLGVYVLQYYHKLEVAYNKYLWNIQQWLVTSQILSWLEGILY